MITAHNHKDLEPVCACSLYAGRWQENARLREGGGSRVYLYPVESASVGRFQRQDANREDDGAWLRHRDSVDAV